MHALIILGHFMTHRYLLDLYDVFWNTLVDISFESIRVFQDPVICLTNLWDLCLKGPVIILHQPYDVPFFKDIICMSHYVKVVNGDACVTRLVFNNKNQITKRYYSSFLSYHCCSSSAVEGCLK